jgi:hypothetical protein
MYRTLQNTMIPRFIVKQDRVVYGKNPGKESAGIAESPTEFNPTDRTKRKSQNPHP